MTFQLKGCDAVLLLGEQEHRQQPGRQAYRFRLMAPVA